jgi:hypothetical protein
MCITPQYFESIMLICFGTSWPFAILKSVRTKSTAGKSIIFLSLLAIGYLSGIVYKLSGPNDPVIWLYIFNGSLIVTEILLYFKHRACELESLC